MDLYTSLVETQLQRGNTAIAELARRDNCVVPVEYHRLSKEAYDTLEKQLLNGRVDNDTSPLAASYKLGIQEALRALRVGFVVG